MKSPIILVQTRKARPKPADDKNFIQVFVNKQGVYLRVRMQVRGFIY